MLEILADVGTVATDARAAAAAGIMHAMQTPPGPRRMRWFVVPAVTVGLVIGALGAGLAQLPLARLVPFFPDDAFFYLKVAHHAALGHGSTFDGINATSGYHPLYLGVLTLLSMAVPLEGARGLLAVVWLDTALAVAWAWVMVALAGTLAWSGPLRWVMLAALLPLVAIGDYGMEVNLLLPLAWGFVWLAHGSAGGWRAAAVAGLVGALACLSRLDSILFVGAVTLGVLVARGDGRWPVRRSALVTALLLVGPSVAALLAHALVNHLVFGRATTVSSWLKVGLQPDAAGVGGRFAMNPQTIATLVCAALALATLARAALSPTPVRVRLAGLGLWVVAYLAVMSTLLRGGMESWYFPLPFSVGVVLGLDLLRDVLAGRSAAIRNGLFGLVALACLALTALEVRYFASRDWYVRDGVSMGQWIDAHLPSDARIYQVDNSGVVGYFANRPVVNGDGLINSWDYQRQLREGHLTDYFRQHALGYLVYDEFVEGAELQVLVPLWNAPALTVTFAVPPRRLAVSGRFALFELRPDEVSVTVPGPSAFRGW